MTDLSARRPRTSLEPQGATFVELFFDLVFVYAVTQVTGLLVHDLSWEGAAQAVVVAWLVWWAWSQFTWTLSPADTTHPVVEVTVLVATAVAFFMARAVVETFDGNPWTFLVPYLVVRFIGMSLYAWVGDEDRQMGRSMAVFGVASIPAVAVLLVGATLEPGPRTWAWALAIALDLGAGVFARRVEWNIHVSHFAERHGLFVIIALGESLIAIGVASAEIEAGIPSFSAKAVGVALVCVMWWLYFGWFRGWLEEHVAASPTVDLIRNSYSFLHFPVVAGVIGVAAALEEMVAHPEDALEVAAATALTIGLVAYVGVVAVLASMAGRVMLWIRIAFLTAMAVVAIGGAALSVDGPMVVATVAVLGAVLAAVEGRGPQDRPES